MALDYKQTGKRLKLVRGRLTQEAFANSLGVSASYVKKMKSGDPDLRSWGKIQFRHAFDSYTARKSTPPSP